MPVSSSTSFTATSAGEYPTSAQPVGYSQIAAVGALHEQHLAVVVADDRADGHLRGHVTRHALADRVQPLLHEVVLLAAHLQRVVGRGLDVGGDVEHLLEPLPLVQALGEPEAGAGDRGERLAPADEIAGEVGGLGVAHEVGP